MKSHAFTVRKPFVTPGLFLTGSIATPFKREQAACAILKGVPMSVFGFKLMLTNEPLIGTKPSGSPVIPGTIIDDSGIIFTFTLSQLEMRLRISLYPAFDQRSRSTSNGASLHEVAAFPKKGNTYRDLQRRQCIRHEQECIGRSSSENPPCISCDLKESRSHTYLRHSRICPGSSSCRTERKSQVHLMPTEV